MRWSTDPEALFGFPSGSFGDELRISGLVHPDDKAVMDEAVASALKTGIYQADYRAVRPDGSIVWLTDRGCLVADADGRPDRMVGITRNITLERQAVRERENLLRAAREARDEAEAASRAKDEFLAMLSHELRNPVNVIAVGVTILDTPGASDEDLVRTRQLGARQVRHLTNLIDDLLDIGRLTSGKIVLSRRPRPSRRRARVVIAAPRSRSGCRASPRWTGPRMMHRRRRSGRGSACSSWKTMLMGGSCWGPCCSFRGTRSTRRRRRVGDRASPRVAPANGDHRHRIAGQAVLSVATATHDHRHDRPAGARLPRRGRPDRRDAVRSAARPRPANSVGHDAARCQAATGGAKQRPCRAPISGSFGRSRGVSVTSR